MSDSLNSFSFGAVRWSATRGFPPETEAEALRRKHAFFPVAFSDESSSDGSAKR